MTNFYYFYNSNNNGNLNSNSNGNTMSTNSSYPIFGANNFKNDPLLPKNNIDLLALYDEDKYNDYQTEDVTEEERIYELNIELSKFIYQFFEEKESLENDDLILGKNQFGRWDDDLKLKNKTMHAFALRNLLEKLEERAIKLENLRDEYFSFRKNMVEIAKDDLAFRTEVMNDMIALNFDLMSSCKKNLKSFEDSIQKKNTSKKINNYVKGFKSRGDSYLTEKLDFAVKIEKLDEIISTIFYSIRSYKVEISYLDKTAPENDKMSGLIQKLYRYLLKLKTERNKIRTKTMVIIFQILFNELNFDENDSKSMELMESSIGYSYYLCRFKDTEYIGDLYHDLFRFKNRKFSYDFDKENNTCSGFQYDVLQYLKIYDPKKLKNKLSIEFVRFGLFAEFFGCLDPNFTFFMGLCWMKTCLWDPKNFEGVKTVFNYVRPRFEDAFQEKVFNELKELFENGDLVGLEEKLCSCDSSIKESINNTIVLMKKEIK